MLLDNHPAIDIPAFLGEYWQKKPLLIPNALPGFSDFLSPQELAGLACEEEVESRLVLTVDDGWQMKNGPFRERDFTFLPENKWTLLVQSVDLWLPELKTLQREVAFLPSWRLDDVMVSYAAAGGGVGPHFDYYDVFLIQGEGSRQWRTGQPCDSNSPVNTDSGLKILDTFRETDTMTLQTGDVLYIPAGLAHWGTALDPGLCYSIGFRAPDLPELLGAVSHLAGESLPADLRFRDPRMEPDTAPGLISNNALQQVKQLMQHVLTNDELVMQGFGRLMTEPRLPELLVPPDEEISAEKMAEQLQKGLVLTPHPASRFAWHQSGEVLTLFVNGECLTYLSPGEKLQDLNSELQQAQGRQLNLKPYQRNEECLRLLATLYNKGFLIT